MSQLFNMAKVDLDLVKFVLQRNFDSRQAATVVEEIEKEMKMLEEENPPAPRVKKQFAVLVSDPEGVLEGKELTGWILQIPEEDSPWEVEDRLVLRPGKMKL